MGAVQLKPFQFRPGQSGNPAGRPVGARQKLEELFIADLHASWQERGNQAITAALDKDPVGYLKVIASLMPKQIEPNEGLDGINRDELRLAIDALQRWVAARADEGTGAEVIESVPLTRLSTLSETG